MVETVIRQLQPDEKLEAAFPLFSYAFWSTPPMPSTEDRDQMQALLDISSVWVLFEDGKAQSIACNSTMSENVRGRLYPVGGIWGVASHPAGRRKGYVRQVMNRLLADTRDEGQVFSTLYAFRESFYERLGYIQWVKPRLARFPTQTLVPLLKRDFGGSVEVLTQADGEADYLDFLRRRQPHIHGLGIFDDRPPLSRRWRKFWLALARVEGQVVGAMAYTVGGPEDERIIKVDGFYYANSQGKYLLLEWVARHTDQAKIAEIRLPPFERPETWLSDVNVSIASIEPPLSRVLDVMRLNGLPTGPGRFSARIHDAQCLWNAGCYRFGSCDGALQVERVDNADCDLTVQALTALIYGTHEPDDFVFRGWGNPSRQAQAAMQAMFPPALPYLHERF
jgi:predicted acetyltransferase